MRRAGLGLALLLGTLAGDASAFVWPSTVDKTSRELRSPDVALRRRAARQLVELPSQTVRRIGLPALSDPDPDVRVAALEALEQAHASGLGERIAAWLGDADARVRRAAAEALSRAPYAPSVPALGRILADPDSTVRAAAARALGWSAQSTAVAPLLGRLDDNEADVREAVTLALARLGDRSAVVPLVGKIQDSRPNVRRSVAIALGALGDARASSALALALRDNDDVVRIAALSALGRIHAEDSVVTIVSLLDEERRPQVREAALGALAQIPSSASIDALLRALSTDDPRERSPVRAALVRAGVAARPKLVACLAGQPPPALADGCALSLGEIGGSGAGAAIASALGRGVVRPEAGLRALGASGDSAGLETALEYLSADDPWVRKAAIEATGALLDPSQPDGRAVEPVVAALAAARGRKSERAELIGLLGKTGAPRVAKLLSALALDTSDVALRVRAIEGLGMVGRSGDDSALLAALGDEHATVRLAAALALRRAGGAETATPLLDRLERAADQDRGALALALFGPMTVTTDPRIVARVEELAAVADDGERALLIEALGAVQGPVGSAALVRLVAKGTITTRAKIVEALASHPERIAVVRSLASDADPSVRANATWALGALGHAEDIPLLERLSADRDPSVSGDAVAALARVSVANPASTPGILCGLLTDSRPYVRTNALAGLRVLGRRCAHGPERSVLATDSFDLARVAAARLLSDVPSTEAALDRSALTRCNDEETDADVAAACKAPGGPRVARTAPVSVYVVPAGEGAPVPHTPFALIRADGFVRLGITDARGSAHEHDAPSGVVRLAVPAPLAE
ncbi:MAG TPA: HEAT repeat domain-containing protein [Polyangiaceae bacterium]|nr:HEAT repeat domain-containing protein [Polyangiaceae bacterium]